MKIFITILFFFLGTTYLSAQKVRLEGDDSKYLCLSDSIAATFELSLEKNKVDSMITILYDFDNGRMENSRHIIIWTHNGNDRIRLIEGCDRITKDTTYSSNLTELWNYIKVTHFDDVTIPIKSGTGQSHDYFYHITVITSHKSFFVVVLDNQRKDSNKSKADLSDTRVLLANKIDDFLN